MKIRRRKEEREREINDNNWKEDREKENRPSEELVEAGICFVVVFVVSKMIKNI